MSKTDLNSLVEQFNKLYLMYRKEFLQQFENSYITRNGSPLTNYDIKQHLQQKYTYGMKLGLEGLTKFIVFDVDVANDLQRAESIAIDIVRTLHECYAIEYDDIHVDFSGKKGYHVTLFFDKVLQYNHLLPFYDEVLERIGVTKSEVEFRCSTGQGMKLPLGINQQTKAFMCFCIADVEAGTLTKLNEKDSYEYFLNIKQIDLIEFRDSVLNNIKDVKSNNDKDDKQKEKDKKVATIINEAQAIEYQSILDDLDLTGKTAKEIENDIKEIININRLKYSGTRHKVTLLLAIFFKSQGYEQDETIGFINSVLLNTYENYRTLISADTSKEFMLKEVVRLVKLTYGKGYQLHNNYKEIRIYKSEIETILSLEKLHHKKLAFSLLIQSKRHANKKSLLGQKVDFYTAYSTLEKMGNTKNRTRLLSYLLELEQMNLIEIVERNELDKERSKAENRVISKPNRYKVLFHKQDENETGLLLKSNEQIELAEVVAHFFTKKEAIKLVPKWQWKTTFKPAY